MNKNNLIGRYSKDQESKGLELSKVERICSWMFY